MAKIIMLKDAAGVDIAKQVQCEDGLLLPPFKGDDPEAMMKNVESIADMPIRNEDVMLHTYPKAGTHWGYEIVSMLLRGSAERKQDQKGELMLETVNIPDIENIPSPRILNTHLPIKFLPKQLEEKKTKILVVMRNPKDVSVSMYHMMKGVTMAVYEGKFKDFLVNFMTGQAPYGSWFDHTLEWEKAMESGKFNVHMAFFEDLKENGLAEIKKIATFLHVNPDDELCKAICEACSFEKMKVEKRHSKEKREKNVRNGFQFYRKGQIGDWKNHFTVAESDAFDELFKEKLATSKLASKIKFEPLNK